MEQEDFITQLSGKQARAWHRTVARMLKDRDLADDVLQESWRRVLASQVSFPTRTEWEKYFTRTLVNTALDHGRERSRSTRLAADLEEAEGLADQEQDQLRSVLDGERARRDQRILREAMALVQGLPAGQRHAIVLLINKRPSETLQDISRREGVAVSTLRSRMYSGIRHLRRLLVRKGLLPLD